MSLEAIKSDAQRRNITRLCHFTPLRNLVHITHTGAGLLSTRFLNEAERREFNQQDLERLDGFPDHISCSIQYPNAYYMRTKRASARGAERMFPNWVCLFLAPDYLWTEGTLLCRHNAAGWRGASVAEGYETFLEMFADDVSAPKGIWKRQLHPDCCPTDMQAEVLVHRQVPRHDIRGIGVEDEDQARDTYAALRQLRAPLADFTFVIAPAFYDPEGLARMLRLGRRPVETTWHPPVDVELAAVSEDDNA